MLDTPKDPNDYKSATSAWQFGVNRSKYHFSTKIQDNRWDTVVGLGKFDGDWTQEIVEAEAAAKPVTIHNRRNTWDSRPEEHRDVKLNSAEKNDVDSVGGDHERTIFRVNHDLAPVFQKMVDVIGLAEHESRLHIQFPTEAFIGHVDRFDLNWPDRKQHELMRIGIMLKDYEQGQFFQFGNHLYQFWQAGDIHTFEYLHVPHYTANSGLSARVTLFTTGIITDKTKAFLKMAKNAPSLNIGDL
jgi:hypothetical protein